MGGQGWGWAFINLCSLRDDWGEGRLLLGVGEILTARGQAGRESGSARRQSGEEGRVTFLTLPP